MIMAGTKPKNIIRKYSKRELREAKQAWKEEGANNEYSEEIAEEYEEPEEDDEWSSYGLRKDSKRTESSDW
jgi:hypothetical protein